MKQARKPMLAIGIDAAEVRLVRRFVEEGHLPAIGRLASVHGWGRVSSPATIGSGAVWPTFITGESPERHGLFGEYAWNPRTLRLDRPSFDHLEPFWRRIAESGRRVAVVDVPFAPLVRQSNLFEIADWGAHDWLGGRRQIQPPALEQQLGDVANVAHPLVASAVDSRGPDDVEGLRHVIRSCAEGARMRGDLAVRLFDETRPDLMILVFTEAHRASHLLWHTAHADHPAWSEHVGRLPDDVNHGLLDVFRAIDVQVGRLLAHVNPGNALVFSLHGMQSARGIPSFLGDVLERWGYVARRSLWQQSMGERVANAARAFKRRVPNALKAAYYSRIPKAVTMQFAQPSMEVPAFDWRRTRAFSLPTDQHGWIRVNLAGRESQGTVSPSDYARTCDELRTRLLRLASPEGRLVRHVTLVADMLGGPPRQLPDLVVEWSANASRSRVRVLDPALESTPVGLKFVSQHDHDGFYVTAGAGLEEWPASVDAAELGERITRAVGLSSPPT